MNRHGIAVIWHQEFWLPNNVTWSQLQEYRPLFPICFSIVGAGLFIFLRLFSCRIVFETLGQKLGLCSLVSKPSPPCRVLEEAFLKFRGKKMTHEEILELSRQSSVTVEYVQSWLRQRRKVWRPSVVQKFSEAAWRFTYYTTIFLFGLACQWNTDWLWNFQHCWEGFPQHRFETSLMIYYLVELSFYGSELHHILKADFRNKDFLIMAIHHIVAIMLLLLSWVCNYVRIGAVLLLIHDASDIFLEGGKIFNYFKWKRVALGFFVVFIAVWIITRLSIFPFWILLPIILKGPSELKTDPFNMFPAFYIFTAILSLLLIFHLIWTYFILKVLYRSCKHGIIEDSRSESGESIPSPPSDSESCKED